MCCYSFSVDKELYNSKNSLHIFLLDVGLALVGLVDVYILKSLLALLKVIAGLEAVHM